MNTNSVEIGVLINLLKLVIAWILFYLLLPRFMFRRHLISLIDQSVANYLQMVLLIIVSGYLMVVLKIWELISLLVLFLLFIWRQVYLLQSQDRRREMRDLYSILIFDMMDKQIPIASRIKQGVARRSDRLRQFVLEHAVRADSWLFAAAFLTVFGFSAYLRFADTFLHMAPAMSDGYVTLGWMKYIDNRELFVDGIYPMGSHIYLDSLIKFSRIDPIYILKLTGPLNSLLIVFSLFFSVSRLTGNRFGGLFAAAAYGIFGYLLLGGDWERQAAANSQELAFMFILPTLYFSYRYLEHNKRFYLWISFAGMCVTGLVHSLAYLLVGLGLASMLAAFLTVDVSKYWESAWKSAAAFAVSIAVAVSPIGLGYLLHKTLHSSSLTYLESATQFNYTPLQTWDFIALGALLLTPLLLIIVNQVPALKNRSEIKLYAFAFIFGLGTFLLYYAGGHLTKSTLLATRSGQLWALILPFYLGIFASLTFKLFSKVRFHFIIEIVLLGAFLAAGMNYYPVQAISPYKLQWDSEIDQYLQISKEFRRKFWMIVSEEYNYDVVLNSGYHMHIQDFLNDFDPRSPFLTKYPEASRKIYVPPDVFIYYYKDIYRVKPTNAIYPIMAPKYELWEANRVKLQQWIELHDGIHHDVKVYYDGPHLRIYHLHRDLTQQERYDLIWGKYNSPNSD
ncbi:hypothetical protein [Ferviditalea candida]|uniref:Glycosyltransferase RgtA/B/C/D-like domain-containing protein n=1 Tax=Ferviditalea candida TaxID=3108399 RepID=A0ABU5ZH47_9BACL|nr:hypothetical protein [Paenibacillaceae bacterium T2]